MYIPQRAAGVGEQLQQWARLVGAVKMAARGLRFVINQRLVRNVCPNCRQAFPPSAEQLQKLGLPAGKVEQLYQASGKIQIKHNKVETCPVCGGTGYLGQTGVFQTMVIGEETRRLIRAGDLKAAMAEARRSKMLYLQEAALRKVVDGETTIDEVVRVLAPSRKSASASASSPKPQVDPAAAS
jgi:type II secretory ATPase GspE/PulE/Tfp pilus assembly ATPase PilB-like protein